MSKTYRDRSGHDVRVRSNGTREVSLSFVGDPGKTEQAHKEHADINYILGQFAKAGIRPQILSDEFQDLTNLPDYQTCLNAVHKIDELFDELSVDIKKEFDQDPALLMQALNDPLQRDRLVELGVLNATLKPIKDSSFGDSGNPSNSAERG